MPRWLFVLLAAAVTLGGIGTVTWTASQIGRRLPVQARALAFACLAAYAGTLWLQPLAWPVIDVAAVVDLLSTSGGLTRLLLDRYRSGQSDLVLFLTLVAPVRGRLVPVVGVGDLLVGGAAATALLRLGVRASRVAIALGTGLLAALGYGLWRGGAPAIPFVAVAVGLVVRFGAAESGRQVKTGWRH